MNPWCCFARILVPQELLCNTLQHALPLVLPLVQALGKTRYVEKRNTNILCAISAMCSNRFHSIRNCCKWRNSVFFLEYASPLRYVHGGLCCKYSGLHNHF